MRKTSVLSAAGSFVFVVVAIGLCVFNASDIQVSGKAGSSLKLVNIKAAQASGYEINCDATNSNPCTIRTASGDTGTGTGNSIRIDF